MLRNHQENDCQVIASPLSSYVDSLSSYSNVTLSYRFLINHGNIALVRQVRPVHDGEWWTFLASRQKQEYTT